MPEATDKLSATAVDPRVLLAEWANENDEWVRAIVAEVVSSGRTTVGRGAPAASPGWSADQTPCSPERLGTGR
ncbi:hypothetical protein EV649_7856 [Kribbella sp. VKM Ac-2569]|nr:hypothetical protein EV649_7856 [Kribbella sp. VKM Ac-2569]